MGEIIDFGIWRQRQMNGLLHPRSTSQRSALPDHVDVYYGFWDRFDEDLTPCDLAGDTQSEHP